MNPAVDNEFQQWLSQINQVCGNFTGRLLTERYTGVLDTHFAKGLKLSTVTTSGVNLSRTWQEVKGSDDAWFYTVFQLSGQAIMEQDERQVQDWRWRYYVTRCLTPLFALLAGVF